MECRSHHAHPTYVYEQAIPDRAGVRGIGADVVGMSTVPEVIAAVHMGMRVLGLSIITDSCLPDALEPVDVEQIIATAMAAEPNLTRLVGAVLERLS